MHWSVLAYDYGLYVLVKVINQYLVTETTTNKTSSKQSNSFPDYLTCINLWMYKPMVRMPATYAFVYFSTLLAMAILNRLTITKQEVLPSMLLEFLPCVRFNGHKSGRCIVLHLWGIDNMPVSFTTGQYLVLNSWTQGLNYFNEVIHYKESIRLWTEIEVAFEEGHWQDSRTVAETYYIN